LFVNKKEQSLLSACFIFLGFIFAKQKTQRRNGGSHIESQDWRKDEMDVLLELTIVSERPRGTNE